MSHSSHDDRTTVLIADDDEDILELVRLGLTAEGFETIIARDGAAALALARERLPDLALIDVSMRSWMVTRSRLRSRASRRRTASS